jgi:hypothetical protein
MHVQTDIDKSCNKTQSAVYHQHFRKQRTKTDLKNRRCSTLTLLVLYYSTGMIKQQHQQPTNNHPINITNYLLDFVR